MELEKQVVSLELAKKLKELGVKQDSYFWWVREDLKRTESNENPWMLWDETAISEYETGKEIDWVSAFTVAELGEMLPPVCIEGETIVAGKWQIDSFSATAEADVRALALIHLLENKLITL